MSFLPHLFFLSSSFIVGTRSSSSGTPRTAMEAAEAELAASTPTAVGGMFSTAELEQAYDRSQDVVELVRRNAARVR